MRCLKRQRKAACCRFRQSAPCYLWKEREWKERGLIFCQDMSHEELFGHLASDNFTAQEAAEYLEVSMSTFRRFVASGKLNPSSTVGRNQLFAVSDLKAFKKALKTARG